VFPYTHTTLQKTLLIAHPSLSSQISSVTNQTQVPCPPTNANPIKIQNNFLVPPWPSIIWQLSPSLSPNQTKPWPQMIPTYLNGNGRNLQIKLHTTHTHPDHLYATFPLELILDKPYNSYFLYQTQSFPHSLWYPFIPPFTPFPLSSLSPIYPILAIYLILINHETVAWLWSTHFLLNNTSMNKSI